MIFGAIGRTKVLYDSIIKCVESGHKLAFIITSRPAPEYKIKEEDFLELSNKYNVPYFCTQKINDTSIGHLSLDNVDICISVNYSTVIPTSFINNFKFGILNAHVGDLPRYRGNAPIAWAIINKEKKIGLCIHYMEGGKLDSGDIICKEYYTLKNDTRIGLVFNWFEEKAPILFKDGLTKVQQTNFKPIKQNDNVSLRSFPRSQEDGKIFWENDSESIIRLINASSEPFSGAFSYYKNLKLTIWRAKQHVPEFNYLAIPGQLFLNNKNVYVITGKGMIEIQEISYSDFRGHPNLILKSIRQKLK